MGGKDRGAVRGTGSRRFSWRAAAAVLVIVVALAVVGLASDSSRSAPVPTAFLTIADQNGANDVPGQQDLTQMGRDDSDPNVYRIFWSWDDTASWLSGGNTGDACALFDTTGDGRTNYEVCGQISNLNANTVTQTASSPAPYSCTPSNANAIDRCQNPILQSFTPIDIQSGVLTAPPAAPAPSPPGNLITSTDPFPTGSNFPNDSTLEVVIRRGFLPANAVLTNVCSHTSIAGGANNNPADCIAPPASGLLVIKKDAGTDTSTAFVFTPTPNPNPMPTYTVTGTGQTNPISLLIGTNSETVSEAVPANWALTAGSCQLSDGASTGTFDNAGNRITGITIRSGLVTTCSFTDVNKPSLSVSKDNDANRDSTFTDTETVPGNAAYPYTVTYQATIRNSAASAATITAISDDNVPAPLRSASGSDTDCADVINTTIPAGTTVVCRYDKTFADAGQAQVVNTVSVTAVNAGGSDTKTDRSIVNFTQSLALSLTKSASPTTYSQPGQTIGYTYVVKNTGNVPLAGPITVTDNKATAACAPDASLGVGQSLTCTASHVVTQADIDAGSVTNSATAQAANGTKSNPATATVNAVPSSGLTLIKSVTPSTYGTVGAQISYSYVVKNTGNVTLAGPVTVTDDKATVTCPTGGLAPNATTTCTATYTITQADLDVGFVTNHATAHANATNSNQDTKTVTAVQRRSLSLDKSTPPATLRDVSNQITYSYLVTNTGNVTLKGPVSVTDDKVAVLCPGGDLAPGASTTCTATYSVLQADLDAGSVVNHATARADGVDSNRDSETVPLVRSPGLILAKAAGTDFQSPPAAGDTIHYSFTIENTGNVTLTGVNLTDALVGFTNQVCGATTLAPRASVNCSADYTLTQADVDAGVRANSATACGTPPPGATPSPTCDSKSTDTPITRSPAITLAKASTKSVIIDPGQVVPYLYFVTNTGNVTLHNVNVTDDRVMSVNCSQSTLGPDASETCTGSHTVTQAEIDAGGNLVNHATAHSAEAPNATAQLSIPIVQSPALKLSKSAFPLSYDHVDQLITYAYKVTNTGNLTLLGPITVNDNMVTVTCPTIGALPPGESITCTATHAVTQADLDAGSITNIASATNGLITSPTDTATVNASQNPLLVVVKSSSMTSLSVPQTVSYLYVVENIGNVTLTGVALSDDNDANDLSCPATTLAPGATMTCFATHTFTQAELDANGSPVVGSGRLVNTVTATSNQSQPTTDSLSIPIVRHAALTLKKSAAPLSYTQVGQLISYSYLITNTGNVTLPGPFTVNDNKVTVSCPPVANLAPGASTTCTASHAIVQADLDAGSIVNVASASNGVVTSPTDTATVSAAVSPKLTVKKSSATTSLSAPQTVTYSYLVTNVGNVTVTGIALSDNNDNNDVSCPRASLLAPEDSMICTATHTFTQAELDANGSPVGGTGELANTVTVMSTQAPAVTASLSIPIVQTSALKLVKSATPSTYDHVGETISYTYVVKNTGNVTVLAPITISDDRLTVACPPIGALAPNASLTCTASHPVTQADLDAGSIVNTAFATNGVVTSPPDSVTVRATQRPSLDLVKTSPTTGLSSPQTVSYSYVVTNTGNVTVTGIALSDDNDNNDLTCPRTSLAPSASMTCSATHAFTQTELDANGSPIAARGELANTVTATSTQAPKVTASLEIPIDQAPALTLKKSARPLSYDHVGEVITYIYDVKNTGNVTLPGPVTVTDDRLVVTCPPVVALAPGASTTCNASYAVVQADLDHGSIVNVASAASGSVTSPEDTVTVPAVRRPLLSVTKSSTTTSLTAAPQTVPYSYLVTNTGNVTLTGILVSDDNVDGDVSCQQTTLVPAESMTCTASHTFTQAELDAKGSPTVGSGVLANTVTAYSDQVSGGKDSLSIPIVQAPALSLAKSATPSTYNQVGQVISYDYKVTNTGNVTVLGQISVTDDKVTVSCPPTSALAPGEFVTCTASHTVTQADIDAGSIVNIATATNGVVTSPQDTATVTAVRKPLLRVAKSSPTTGLTKPQTVDYSYLVTNTGNVTLTAIGLNDDNDANDLSCPATSLVPGDSMTCTASHAFTQAELDANGSPSANSGVLANTVTASSNQAPIATDRLSIPIVQERLLTLKKSVSPLSFDTVGEVLAYSYVVTNAGNVTLPGPFTVSDDHETVTCPSTPSLAPAASINCTASHTITQADLDAGSITNVASATNGVVTSPTDTATASAAQQPALAVHKSSETARLTAPQTVEYSYLVTNTGNVTVTGIALSDDNDDNDLNCPLASLAPGVSMTCAATHTFTQAELDANGSPTPGSGKLANTVTATSNEAPPASDSLLIPIVRTPALSLVKSASPLLYDHVGQEISYSYDVTNTGNVTALGQISVTDDRAIVVCPPVAALAPGDSVTCDATYSVVQADIDAGSIVNTASATNGVVTSPTDTARVEAVQRPSLVVVKSSPTSSLTAPQTVDYSYLVTNTGNVTVTGIALSDDNASAVTCQATSLAPGQSTTCTASHAFTQAELDANGSPTAGSGRLANTVTASSNEAPPATDKLAIPIVSDPDLLLSKSASPLSYDHVGELISYAYKVTNGGNTTLLGRVTVTDDKVGVLCPQIASLAPGASVTCTASHTVTQPDLDRGSIVNTATATIGTVDSLPDTVTVEAVAAATLSVVKSSTTTSLSAPQAVDYSYVVTNSGNVTVTGIALADDNDNNDLVCPQASLAPGGSMTCTASHTFTQAELDANGSPTTGSGSLTNTVTATSDQAPQATDTLAIPIAPHPRLVLVKVGVLDKTVVGPNDRADAGDKVDYTITATNAGNVTVQNVTISDPSQGLTCIPSQPTSLAPGAQLQCKGSRTLTQADVNGGSVTNTATVSGTTPTGQPVNDTDSATVLLPEAAALSLTKSAAESSFHLAGDVLHYTYVVTNTGNLRLAGPITATDDKTTVTCLSPTTVGNQDTFLNPGESVTCSATYTVTAADLTAGKVTNTATAGASGTVSDPASVTVPFTKLSSTTTSDIHDAQHQVVTAVAAGALVHDRVSVAGPAEAPAPSGTVTLDWFTNATCTGSPASTSGNVALDSAGHADAATFTQGPLAAGTYAFRAHYRGDATYTASDGPCEPLRVVDANIQLGPSATNPVGAAHTFTAHVNVNNGSALANALDGTSVGFTIVSGPGAFTTPSPCVTSGGTGSCSITLVSNSTGTTMVSAQATVSVSGVSLPRQTNGTGGSSGPATKLWAAASARSDIINSSGAVTTSVTASAVVHDQVFVSKAPGTPDAVPAPSGTVMFHRYTTLDCTGTPTNQSVPLTPGNPSTAVSDNFAATANMSYSAEYLGNAAYPPAVGACEALTVTPAPAPAIAIVKNPANQTVAVSGKAKFKITVTNSGNMVLTKVIVRDPAATACKRTSAQIPALASLNPGASVTYSCAKTNVRASFTNVATAFGTTPSGQVVSATDSAAIKAQRFTPKPVTKPKKPTASHKKPKSTG